MLLGKAVQKGKVAGLDGSDKSTDVVDLTQLPGAALLPMEGPGPFANPDGAAGTFGTIPGVMQVQSPGNIRGANVSGKGTLHPTARTDVPK